MKTSSRPGWQFVVIFSILLVFSSLFVLGFTGQQSGPGCREVRGRLFNAIAGEGPGRMIGTISGDYWIHFPGESFNPDDTSVLFTWGDSYVEGNKGSIFFNEYAAIDYEEQYGTNGAVLLVVMDGTGIWENASGYVTLSGYYHTSEQTGVWDYQGEVCYP